MTKIIIKWVGGFILGIVLTGFFFYAFFGFTTFLFSDPFHWIKPAPPTIYVNRFQADIDACRAKGMFPVVSGWDGSLKECKSFIK